MPKPRKVATPVNNLTKVDSDTSGEGGFVFKRKLRNTAEGRRALYADLDKQAEQLSKDFRAHTQTLEKTGQESPEAPLLDPRDLKTPSSNLRHGTTPSREAWTKAVQDARTQRSHAMCKTWMDHSEFEPGRRASNEDLPQLFDAGEPTAGAARDEEGEGAMVQNRRRRSDPGSQEA
ncbi:hypothetical protein JCM5350_005771 [Sporobolomyces pararoseus]